MVRKTHKFGHAEEIIREYPENMRLLAEKRGDIIHATANRPEVLISGQGRTGDPTASKGIKIADDNNIQYLKDATKAVRLALDDFKDDERYEQIYTIINLFYFKQSHTIDGAAMAANYSKRQATRIKNLFVKTVMIYLGWALPN